ncbi:MAG: hypothetical protein WCF18_12045 [Chthoniobacteraceae bacterium]
MPEHSHDRGHRTRHARTFIVIAFLLQRLGDAAVIWFTFQPSNPTLLLRGVAIGSFLCTSVLLIGVWRRLRWARYVLTAFDWVYVTGFSFLVLQAWSDVRPTISNPYVAVICGVILYAGANVILVRSRRVRHFANR